MRFLPFFALAVGLAACAFAPTADVPPNGADCRPGDRVYRVDTSFSLEERYRVEQAIERWNAVSVQRMCATYTGPSNGVIRRVERYSAEWQRASAKIGGNGIVLGWCYDWRSLWITNGLPIDDFELVVMHELGHAHGLDHVEQSRPSIMNKGVGQRYDFSAEDMAECKRVHACQ